MRTLTQILKAQVEMILGYVAAINYGYSNGLDTNLVPQLTRQLVCR